MGDYKAQIGKDKHRYLIQEAQDAWEEAQKFLDDFLSRIESHPNSVKASDLHLLLNYIRKNRKVWQNLTEMKTLVIEANAEEKILRFKAKERDKAVNE